MSQLRRITLYAMTSDDHHCSNDCSGMSNNATRCLYFQEQLTWDQSRKQNGNIRLAKCKEREGGYAERRVALKELCDKLKIPVPPDFPEDPKVQEGKPKPVANTGLAPTGNTELDSLLQQLSDMLDDWDAEQRRLLGEKEVQSAGILLHCSKGLKSILDAYESKITIMRKRKARVQRIMTLRNMGGTQAEEEADLMQFDDEGNCLLCGEEVEHDRNHRCWEGESWDACDGRCGAEEAGT